jgi:hypothetical protein
MCLLLLYTLLEHEFVQHSLITRVKNKIEPLFDDGKFRLSLYTVGFDGWICADIFSTHHSVDILF